MQTIKHLALTCVCHFQLDWESRNKIILHVTCSKLHRYAMCHLTELGIWVTWYMLPVKSMLHGQWNRLHNYYIVWIPAFAGMTANEELGMTVTYEE